MCYCPWSFLSKIQRFFQVFLRPSANSTFTRSAFGLWCTPWHKDKHLVQTTGMRLVKSSVPVHLACDTKNWTCTVPCGCGIRWPERRDSDEKTEETELGELGEQERWRKGRLRVEMWCFGYFFVPVVVGDWDWMWWKANSTSSMERCTRKC